MTTRQPPPGVHESFADAVSSNPSNGSSHLIEALESAGSGMANICFNLSQDNSLPASVRQSMKTGQMQWDAALWALRAARAEETPPPQSQMMAMDEEDRTPVPQGFDAAQWQKADEVHHAAALVANDTECVKIIYAALLSSVRDGVEEALQIAKEQARLMADLAIEGLPENAREREAMEAALTRFSESLRVTLEGLATPSPQSNVSVPEADR